MAKKQQPSLAALDKELQEVESKVLELNQKRAAILKEQRIAANRIILNNVDALLVFATHQFKGCTDARSYTEPYCPRCRLLEIKHGKDAYGDAFSIDENDEWVISISVTPHE